MMKTIGLTFLWSVMMLSGAERVLVHGHRGARSVKPENTLSAFEYAISVGADYLELDLAVTKDGVLVVSHDPLINESICQGPGGERMIHKLTLAEVKAWDCGSLKNKGFPKQEPVPGTKIPTFDEVLDLAKKSKTIRFNVEIKSDPKRPELQPEPEEFARMTAAAIRKHKLEKRVIVQSFDFRTLHAMKKVAPELTRCALYGGTPKSFLKIAEEAGGVSIVAAYFALVNAEEVSAVHAAGMQVVPWTPNTVEAWDKLLALKVDAIITDDPGVLIEHLKAKGLR
jgi:glycerophosphoryl diester phosphodiesterase